ncbi:MAG TPA: transposase [Ignavibacteria bacterium]|nr:transposase [Ignavibacteria bacterium]
MKKQINLKLFFSRPVLKKQKQYEAVRSFVIDELSAQEAADKFGYKLSTVYTFIKNAKSGDLDFFPDQKKGPTQRRVSFEIQKKIFRYRNQNLSHLDIAERLNNEGIEISAQTVARILNDAGFPKLKRRTNKELGLTVKNKIIPDKSENIDFSNLEKFQVDTPYIGIFFFIPYIIESGIIDVVKNANLPGSSTIGSVQACLSMLTFKLIGNERLSHMESYDKEMGLGVFAGLNVLPKNTYMSTYSCLTSTEILLDFQKQIVKSLQQKYPLLYHGDYINLDFHSIPHYGDQSQMEKVWVGAKHKTMKGADTVIAQDAQSNMILYTRADILRKEESEEVLKFVRYWKQVNGTVEQTLVFDCKFTKYEILDQLESDGVQFITLRKRYKKLTDKILEIPDEQWTKVNLSIPKRKYNKVLVYEQKVRLPKCQNEFRQIAVKDNGREKPTFIITNDNNLSLKSILEVYARRWRVENKLAELVAFFNMNALSSPLMIRIHFDILWTMIADTLYHILAQDLRRFEKSLSPTIFKKFINFPGKVIYDGENFQIKIRKRAHTPVLKDVAKLQKPITVPWLDNKKLEIIWTP